MRVAFVVVGESLLLLLLFATLTVPVHGNPDAKRLYDDLLSNYNKLVRPVVNVSDALAVQIKLKLSQLIDVNLKNQIMTTNLWVEQTWYDYKLKWEPKDYGGVEMLHVPSDHIWRPDIVLYNNADGNFEVTLATKTTLDYTGRVEWRPPAIYKSSCEIDVEYFPFDEQTCVMKFGSWTYDGFQVDLRHIDESNGTNVVDIGIDLSEFYTSVEWDILEVPAIRHEKFYTCCDEPYLDITFNITMRRKTLFYTVNLIIPCMGISFLTILVFYLPSDSGEKVSLSISILLSLTVFFLLLAEIIPPTSLVVPLLGKFVLFTMILDTFSICVTVIVLNVHFRSPQTHTMAPWVRTVFINHLPKLLFMRRPIYPYDRLRGPGAHRFLLRTCNAFDLPQRGGGGRGSSSACDYQPHHHPHHHHLHHPLDSGIPPLPPSVVMQSANHHLLEHQHHHHLLDMEDGTDSLCLNQCRMHGGNCPTSSSTTTSDVVVVHHPHGHHHLPPPPPSASAPNQPTNCVNVANQQQQQQHHNHHLHYQQQQQQQNTRQPFNSNHHSHHHLHQQQQQHPIQGVYSPTSSTSSSPQPLPRKSHNQLHRQLKTCCLSPDSSDTLSCGGHRQHDHSVYADHELMPAFHSAGDLRQQQQQMSPPHTPGSLIVDPIITSIAAVAAAAATAALTSLKADEVDTSGLSNKTLTTTTTITTPKRLKLAMAGNTKRNLMKSIAGATQGGGVGCAISSVSISDNSISISQSLEEPGNRTGTATKASQTPKSAKKKTTTATATITKQLPGHSCAGGLITTSATITGETECALVSESENEVSPCGQKEGQEKKEKERPRWSMGNGKVKCVEDKGEDEGVEEDEGDEEEENEEEDEGNDDDEEMVDELLVNGSGENLVGTAISPRNHRKGKPKKLKTTPKTKNNPRSNTNSNHKDKNKNNYSNVKKNAKQFKTNFNDIAADGGGAAAAAAGPAPGASEPPGCSSTNEAKPSGLRNRWHGCPELQKAMAGVNYIADHTRKEEEGTRVKEDWKFVAMVLDRLFLWLFTIAVVFGTAGIILHAPTLYDTRVPIDIKMSEIATTTAKPHIARPIL